MNSTAQPNPDAPDLEHVAGELEASGKVQFDPPAKGADGSFDELSEMRTIARRLEALPTPARQRVMAWLQARFAA
jgi:hypothetical protein